MTPSNATELSAIFYPGPSKRPHYVAGMVLGVDDLTAEFEYHRGKLRRHILRFHGYGIVEGLKVSVRKDTAGWAIVVAPGLAIDSGGNEIELCTEITVLLPAKQRVVELQIRYAERLCDPQPALESETGTEPSRVEEGFEVLLVPGSRRRTPHQKLNGPDQCALSIARLVRTSSVWRVDRTFKPHRAH